MRPAPYFPELRAVMGSDAPAAPIFGCRGHPKFRIFAKACPKEKERPASNACARPLARVNAWYRACKVCAGQGELNNVITPGNPTHGKYTPA